MTIFILAIENEEQTAKGNYWSDANHYLGNQHNDRYEKDLKSMNSISDGEIFCSWWWFKNAHMDNVSVSACCLWSCLARYVFQWRSALLKTIAAGFLRNALCAKMYLPELAWGGPSSLSRSCYASNSCWIIFSILKAVIVKFHQYIVLGYYFTTGKSNQTLQEILVWTDYIEKQLPLLFCLYNVSIFMYIALQTAAHWPNCTFSVRSRENKC